MKKHKLELEWQILEESSKGCNAPPLAALTVEIPANSQRPYRLYSYVASVALPLLFLGTWLWVQAQAGVDQVETELQHAAETELWAAAHHDVELAIDLAADPMTPAWHRQFTRDDSTLSALQAIAPTSQLAVDLHVIELENEWAKVQMRVVGANDSVMYRQTRFYRQTAEGWLRTAPSVERWGTLGSLQSDYFVLTFRQHDAEIVAEVAPQLDALYSKLRHTLGLTMSTGDAKMVIEISPTELPGEALLRSAPVDRFVVPSPSHYLAPVDVTDAELLLQSLALLFITKLVDEAIMTNNIYWVRDQVPNTLRLWLLWDLNLPLASWHEEIVQWRLTGVQAASQQKTAPMPHHYAELCALPSVWLPSPVVLSIPLTCDEGDHIPMYAPPPDTLSAAQLEQLATNIFVQVLSPVDNMQMTAQPGDTVILTTLVEYMVIRYGREQLPALLAALGQHKSWTTLSPAVFGVSAAEFAADWHAYLAAHYGLLESR